MKIREAVHSDKDQIIELYKQLFSRMGELEPEIFKEGIQDKDFINSMVEAGNSLFLVAEDKEQLVAFILAVEQSRPEYVLFVPKRHVYIMDLIVRKDYKRQGIASDLIQRVEHWAEKRGIDEIELNALTKNTEALELYDKKGYRPYQQMMRKKL